MFGRRPVLPASPLVGAAEIEETGKRDEAQTEEEDPRVVHDVFLRDVLTRTMVDDFATQFDEEQSSYDSLSVLAEIKMREARAKTEGHNAPNSLRTAVACEMLCRVGASVGRFQPLMESLLRELLPAIYDDYEVQSRLVSRDPETTLGGLADGGLSTRSFYRATPHFEKSHSLAHEKEQLVEELMVYNRGIDLRNKIKKSKLGLKLGLYRQELSLQRFCFRGWWLVTVQRYRYVFEKGRLMRLKSVFRAFRRKVQVAKFTANQMRRLDEKERENARFAERDAANVRVG